MNTPLEYCRKRNTVLYEYKLFRNTLEGPNIVYASLALWPDILGYGNSYLMGCYAVSTGELITLPSSSGPRSRRLEPEEEGITILRDVDPSCSPKLLVLTSQKTASLAVPL